jgi:hypothetical protein
LSNLLSANISWEPISEAGWYANASPLCLGSTRWVGIKRQHATTECSNYHGQADLFLLEADVDPDELEANRDVIVREVPESQ